MPYKEEETETVLPFRGGFRRGSWNARRALLRPLYCLLVGDNISVLLSALGTPSGLLEQSLWFYLERPLGPWNSPPPLRGVRGSETPLGLQSFRAVFSMLANLCVCIDNSPRHHDCTFTYLCCIRHHSRWMNGIAKSVTG